MTEERLSDASSEVVDNGVFVDEYNFLEFFVG